jgi:hypothetical protein
MMPRRALGPAWAGVLLLLASPAPALSIPSAQDLVDRVLAAARRLDVSSVQVTVALRLGEGRADPPACRFHGVLEIWPTRSALTLREWTARPLCWVIAHYVLGRLLEDRDRVDSLLPRFRFDVLGVRSVGGRLQYLVYGQARTPGAGPQWVSGWVEYERGLVLDGTAHYPWGEVSSTQEYAPLHGLWVPVRQVLEVPRFHASLEILYSDFRFGAGGKENDDGRRPPGVHDDGEPGGGPTHGADAS